MARASRPAAVANAGRALELKRLRVNDNDGGGDGDGSHADEGGSDVMMNRRMMVMMTATAMRVMMTITTRNDGAGDGGDLFPQAKRSPSPQANACAHTGRQFFSPGKRSPSPHSHCQEALHCLHARLVQAPSCAEIFAQGLHLIFVQLELEAASHKCQTQQWHVCRKGLRTQTVTKIQPAPDSAAH